MTNDQKLVTRPNLSSANVATTGSSPIAIPLTVADTGCTSHFLLYPPQRTTHQHAPCHFQSIPVTVPNGAIMYSSHFGELDLPTLPPVACIAHVFPDLAPDSLLYWPTLRRGLHCVFH